MKAIISILLILFSTQSYASQEITLMSYNIRLDIASDGPNAWPHRKAILTEQIRKIHPDILGVQEALPQQIDFLDEALDAYDFVGVGRDDGVRAGEHSAIFYLSSKYELLVADTFWLSETPDSPTFGWGASHRRICTYAQLRDKASGTTYWVFNTHFDHETPEARQNGAKLILERIEHLVTENEPHFLMGDLNAEPDSPPIKAISNTLLDSRDVSRTAPSGPVGTFNGFDIDSETDRRIDYIFASSNVSIRSYEALAAPQNRSFPSDHFPVVVRASLPTSMAAPRSLSVSKDQRHLVTDAGTPFFWLGDTAWELFHRLTLDEAIHYLSVRQSQGFNVVQAVVLAEQQGLTVPNANGDLPLEDLDPTKPNEAYFEHVDSVIREANKRGIVIGLLPTWGDKFAKKWGVGPEVFTPQNARTFGEFLSDRYASSSIVWILGGDRTPEDDEDLAIVNAMAKGVREGGSGRQLITYHPQGRSKSSSFFHDQDWLDFNMHQSGHGDRDYHNYLDTYADFTLDPTKPTLDGEPCYEDIPIGFDPEKGWFGSYESRRAGYWSVLSGALGHTYGHHGVWQMWQPGRYPVLQARTPWQEAIHYPGAFQAGYMKKAFETVPWTTLSPAQNLLSAVDENRAHDEIRVAANHDQSILLAYAPKGERFQLDLQAKATDYAARWFDPRTGQQIPLYPINEFKFDPPGEQERGNDWLLILEREKTPNNE